MTLRGTGNLDLRGMVGRIFVGTTNIVIPKLLCGYHGFGDSF